VRYADSFNSKGVALITIIKLVTLTCLVLLLLLGVIVLRHQRNRRKWDDLTPQQKILSNHIKESTKGDL
jgi:hypothetical protein